MGGTCKRSWTGGSAVAWMNCSISMTCCADRIVSGCCGSMAGACGGGSVAGACGGGSVALGSFVAGCSGATCAFCGCRCHREGWQQSGRFFMRTVIPRPLGFQKKDRLATQGQAPS